MGSVLCVRTCICFAWIFFTICAGFQPAAAQQPGIHAAFIKGEVVDQFTKERVAFASLVWKKAGSGVTTDSVGHFRIAAAGSGDTLLVSYVGFETRSVPFSDLRDSGTTIYLLEARQREGVVVKSKFNRGLHWWKRIVAAKPRNNPYRFDSYSYELYNKMELDLNNITRNKFEQYKLLRPFGFILDNIDSLSEDKPFLPIFMTESLSDYYYSVNPYRAREEIKAVQTNGIRNESMLQFVGGLNQRINVYENYINLFGKEFISPLSDIGNKYYNYQGADTQYISGKRYFHLLFSPLREGENTFSGDCWVQQSDWAIWKIELEISRTAPINFVNRLNIIQEFAQQPDSVWLFSRDKWVADIAPLKKNKLSLIARKTSIYNKVTINQPGIARRLDLNSEKEQVIVSDSAGLQSPAYWAEARPEPLSLNEQKVYKMIDTLKTIPLFKKYKERVEFIVDGRAKMGKLEIGPWFRWISSNQLERFRLRFDLATTEQFSRSVRLHGYLAYGFGDRRFKGKTDINYKIPGNSGLSLQGSYTHDLDNGRSRYNDEDVSTDNMFSRLIRRAGIRQKFLQVDEIRLAATKEWDNKISAQLFLTRSAYETFNPLPPKSVLTEDKEIFNTEAGLRLRYSPGEKKITTRRKDIRFHGTNPVFELRYAMGLPELLGADYRYKKLNAMITQHFRIPRWGRVDYRVYGGRTWGEPMPFMLLELHPGNEIYYYNKDAFNLMNRFEFVSDRFAGFSVEHNFEKKLINLLPFMRKSNIRQFWNIKGVWGDLSTANRELNHTTLGEYHLHSLNGHVYTELGTGLDNICKFFRVDLVWRFSPDQHLSMGSPGNPSKTFPRFGVFGSFHLQL